MGFADFRLSVSVTSLLYKNSLVDVISDALDLKKSAGQQIEFAGSEVNKILVLLSSAEDAVMSKEDLGILKKLLTGVSKDLSHVCIVNVCNKHGLTHELLTNDFAAPHILCFGLDLIALDFPLAFPHFQLQAYDNRRYLAAPALKELIEHEQKAEYWKAFRKMFQV